ncbi:MAG TPA: [acyl-carrier-protein] S-malonyltransferase [Cyanobacteria bacterium UBA8156]|nr:[acyl-carrier-protein] S-malonyltransferase [Cyanobacteria bacterium UBA8156]
MTQTVWLFPGQGSQRPGMGQDLQTVATPTLQTAQEVLGWSVAQVWAGSADILAQTAYTQPCLYVFSAILVDELKKRGDVPTAVAGHSLGEYVALYAAGVWDFATGLRLVQKRSQLMAQVTEGVMAALMGFDRAELTAAIAHLPEVVLANDNSPDQVVVAGTPAGLQMLKDKVKIKRMVPLPVSGAFHSPWMAAPAAELATLLQDTPFADAHCPVYTNVEPHAPTTSGPVLQQRAIAQMTAPVRWREICQGLAAAGYRQAWEVGPGNVLAGLVKRTTPEIAVQAIDGLAALNDKVMP